MPVFKTKIDRINARLGVNKKGGTNALADPGLN
jgi:hypothetical protein